MRQCATEASMRHHMVLVLVVFVTLSSKTKATLTDTISVCPGFEEDRCKCTRDLSHFVCRTSGFKEIPQKLPMTVTKL